MPDGVAEHLIKGLRSAGMRITGARREVCAVLAEAPGDHLTAAEIVARVATPVDTSTVYRTLETLERIGSVTHVHLGHGPGVYHVASSRPHHHLVCNSCGTAVDVPAQALQDAVSSVTEPRGFIADITHFAIVGHCRACAADAQ